MKKILSILLCFMMVVAILPIAAVCAQTTTTIAVAKANAKQGDSVEVKISIQDNVGILAMAFCVTYDSSALEYLGYNEGYLSNYNVKNHTDKGLVSFVSVEEEELDTNGTMISILFKVKEDADFGKYEIGIVNNNPDKYGESLHNSFANAKEQFIIPIVNKGYVNVADIMLGDVNGDLKVNGRDYTLLMQYLNNWDVTIIEDAADVNADGKINGRDYTLLMQYLNNWDVEFG